MNEKQKGNRCDKGQKPSYYSVVNRTEMSLEYR